jgi:hypothetical protein
VVVGCGLWVVGEWKQQAELVFGVWSLVGAGRNERRSRGNGGAREEEEEAEEEEEKMTMMKQSQNIKIPYFSVATSD